MQDFTGKWQKKNMNSSLNMRPGVATQEIHRAHLHKVYCNYTKWVGNLRCSLLVTHVYLLFNVKMAAVFMK